MLLLFAVFLSCFCLVFFILSSDGDVAYVSSNIAFLYVLSKSINHVVYVAWKMYYADVRVLKENNTEFVHMLLHNVDAVCGVEMVCYALHDADLHFCQISLMFMLFNNHDYYLCF